MSFLGHSLSQSYFETQSNEHQYHLASGKIKDLFSASMLHSRFKFINCFITFDDKASRTECWKTDKFACIRELSELMNVGKAKCRYPSPILSVDETLYPYRGVIGFK